VVAVGDGDERADEGGGEIGWSEEEHLAREPDDLKALDLVVQVNVQAPHHKMLKVDEVSGDGIACLGHDATKGPQCSCAHLDRFVRKWNPKA